MCLRHRVSKYILLLYRGDNSILYQTVIVDDEIWVAKGLAEIVDWEEKGFYIKGVYADPLEAMEAIRNLKPDVVFVDIRMYSLMGFEMIETLKKEGLNSEFVLISAYQEFTYAQKGIDLGVFCYIVKPFEAEVVIKCLDRLSEKFSHKSSKLLFPVFDPSFYNSEDVDQFIKNAMTASFYRIIFAQAFDIVQLGINATYMSVEGGIDAWFLPYTKNEIPKREFEYFPSGTGVSMIHNYGKNLSRAVREAFYSKYCEFHYSDNETVGEIQFYLCENMVQPISINEIAEHFNFSTTYICTLFKRHTKQTIINFQQYIRIHFSIHIISTTNDKLINIAKKVGYDDYSYFGKLFKRLTGGKSPEMLRRD